MSTELYIALFLIAFAVISYIILDGSDLGIGMLMPFNKDKEQQYLLQNIIVTVWDANESWIILVGTLLWGALPGAYAELLPDSYPFFIMIILGFILRALSMEFSHTRKEFLKTWRYVFVLASWMSALAQGLIAAQLVGNFVNPANANPFLVKTLITLAVILLYIINGMNFQGLKTVGKTRRDAVKFGKIAIILFLITLFVLGGILSDSNNLLIPIDSTLKPILITIFGLMVLLQLGSFYMHFKKTDKEIRPVIYLSFATNILLVITALLFIYPNITPSLTIADAANPSSSSMWFLVIGVGLCIPIVTWYNTFALRVFKGKHKHIDKD